MAKLFDKDITKGVIGNAVFQVLWNGVSAMIGIYTAHSAYLNGIPLYLVIIIGVVIFFLLSLIWFLVNARRYKQEPKEQDESHAPVIESDVEKRIETLNAQHESECKRLQKDYAILKAQNDGLHAELAKQTWLYNIASTQAEQIDQFVTLDRIERGDTVLDDSVPYIKFGICVVNKSILDVSIELKAGGYIVFKDTKLMYPIDGVSDGLAHIRYQSESRLVIEQRLSREEADYIASHKENDNSTFYFDKLTLTIKGVNNQHPQVAPKQLNINKGITLQNKLLTFSR